MIKKSLAENFPELVKQWHPILNGNKTPFDLSSFSNKKVWWKCDKGKDHEWEASPANRINRKNYTIRNCPICSGHKTVLSNSLLKTHPKIAKQWHSTKNGDLKPSDFSQGSQKKIWWKCSKGKDHEWEASISSRKNSGCPICSGHKIVKSNCLLKTHPQLAKEWHPTKNKDLNPSQVGYGTGKKVWWKCPKGDDHEYEMSILMRTQKKQKCPICYNRKVVNSNCFATTHPNHIHMWHEKNKISPYKVVYGSEKQVWWKCNKGKDHEWLSPIYKKAVSRHDYCPFCDNKQVSITNSLKNIYPKISKEWHPTKNKNLQPKDVVYSSSKEVWWKCSKGHEWKKKIIGRTLRKRNCPYCTNQKVTKSNSVATTHPNILKKWHPTKNKKLTPYDIVYGTSKKVWWICDINNSHSWQTTPRNIINGTRCPICFPGGFNIKKEGYLYTHLIYHDSGKKIALKFGITNKYGFRIKDLKKGLSLYKIKNIFYFKGDGISVQNIESEIIKKYDTGYITNEIMKSGFTETIKYSDKVLVEIYNLCNKKLKFKSGKKLYMKRLLNIFN